MGFTEDAFLRSLNGMALRVLASGSGGNCSVLVVGRGGMRRVCLIDLGLSPRRTARLLAESGLTFSDVDDAILTHADSDHYYSTWARMLPRHVRLRVHRRHLPSIAASGVAASQLAPFDEPFVIQPDLGGAIVSPVVTAHDVLGSVAYRFDLDIDERTASLGYATDLGHVTDRLVSHMRGVDVLAIESNYCPRMQAESDRPDFLKRRITGGAGHLSNQQCRDAIQGIGPAGHVVLLHLSRECNLPELAAGEHTGAAYALTVSTQHEPTGWVSVLPRPASPRPVLRHIQAGLFESSHQIGARP